MISQGALASPEGKYYLWRLLKLMKRFFSSLFCIMFLMPCVYAQSLAEDVSSFLKPGQHLAEIISLTSKKVTPRQTELLNKVSKAMALNASWFKDSLANITNLSAYHEKFGLTTEEFAEYLVIGDNKTAGSTLSISARDTLTIIRKGNLINFHGSGRLKALDSLRLDLTQNKAVYKNYELTHPRKREIKDSTNPFNSALTGYEYNFEDYGDPSLPLDVTKMNTTRYNLQVGRVVKTGKTFLNFTGLQYIDGKLKLSILVPCMFE